jgi:daunorubicin C-13 ketoreductase
MSVSLRIPDLHDRTVVVTGATSGIGKAAALQMAGLGARLLLVGRDITRLDAVVAQARRSARHEPIALHADLTSFAQMRALGERLRQRYEHIDVLASNAGGMYAQRVITADGFEQTIQTNHLSGFLLAHLLREQLRGGRVILTASDAYTDGTIDPDDLNGERVKYHPGRAYASSKQANILTAQEAAKRWPDTCWLSYHPGQVRTRFGRGTIAAPYFRFNPFLRSASKGAELMVWLARVPVHELLSGGYYGDGGLRAVHGRTAQPELAARLWEASSVAVGLVHPQ